MAQYSIIYEILVQKQSESSEKKKKYQKIQLLQRSILIFISSFFHPSFIIKPRASCSFLSHSQPHPSYTQIPFRSRAQFTTSPYNLCSASKQLPTMADFPTTILTSKSPEDVANFLPKSLQLSQTLIEQNLVAWFSNYLNMIMRYNHDLNTLVANGRHFFTSSEGEFGAIDKIWNCVALCVMSQIHVNDLLLRTIRNDIIGPFNAAFKEDFKYSELLINSQELLQMLGSMDDAEGAYNWNVKAPAILLNFENYKRFEKDLLFNAFIAYLNVVNSKNASLLSKNENAVNFILKEFNIDKEMENYTDFMVKTKVEAPPKPAPIVKETHAPQKSKTASSAASTTSGASSSNKERRKSKLMLKFGSIMGRKKKSGVSHSEAIPEDRSVASTHSRQNSHVSKAETRNSLYQPPAPVSKYGRRDSAAASFSGAKPSSVSIPPAAHAGSSTTPAATTAPVPAGLAAPDENTFTEASAAQGVSSSPPPPPAVAQHVDRTPTSINSKPMVPSKGTEKSLLTSTAPITDEIVSSNVAYAEDEPNIEKYTSSDDESDGPTDTNGHRLSLLKANDLGNTPKINPEEVPRAASAGKYSFEYGDEEKSISTPTQTPRMTNTDFESATEALLPVYDDSTAKAVAPEKTDHIRPPPPPPPSRKKHPTTQEERKETPLPTSNNFVPAHDGMSLRSQMTGSSLLKQDYFKHFDAADDISRPGLNTSIAEIVNVTITRGLVSKCQVLGEVAFNYNSSEALDSVAVKIPSKFNRFLLNEQLMHETSKGVYALNVNPILGKTLGGIKYLLDIDPQEVPILIKQIWKTEETQASLIVKIIINPAYSSQIKLENFVVSASLDTSVSSTSASSKPEGSFNKDANRITWRYSKPLILSASNPEEKLIARIMTNGQARESAAGVRLKFSVSLPEKSFAKILDMDDKMLPSVINLSSGNYSSHFN